MSYLLKNFEKFIYKLAENPVEYKIENIHKKSDKGYKYLLSIKKNFIDLLKTFIDEPWKDEITEENLELVDKEFIAPSFERRESDLIYKVKIKEEEIYFVLLEFQSRVDKKMSFRILNYMVEIWRNWERNNELEKFKLPVIVPIVIYSGKTKWKVSTNFSSLFNSSANFNKYIPDFEYTLLALNNYKDEELLEIGNVISSAFYIGKSKEKEIVERLKKICSKMKKLNEKEKRFMINWASKLLSKDFSQEQEIQNQINKGEEIEMEGIIKWAETVGRGYEGGVEKGRREGKREGKVAFAKKVLIKKLGNSNEEILRLLDSISEKKLKKLEDSIFEIESWEDVLDIIKS